MLRIAKNEAGYNDQDAAADYLHDGNQPSCAEEAMAYSSNRTEFNGDYRINHDQCDTEVLHQEGQSMARSPQESHQPRYSAARHWITTPGQHSII